MKYKWIFHPITIFIVSLLALGMSLYLYIHWYLKATEAFNQFISRYNINPEQVQQSDTWVVILILSILVGIILVGILIIFIYNQKVIQLYRQQQNFINGFTHELKTPITSLKLYLDTFKIGQIPPSDQLKYWGMMEQDLERLRQNVENILEMGRLEGDGDLFLEIIDLKKFLVDLVNKEKKHYPEMKIDLHIKGEGPFLCKIEQRFFSMMVSNLIKNALIHNYEKNPTLKIELIVSDYYELNFVDNGKGIEKKQLKKIFKKFYQVGKTSKGTGIGLYIVGVIARMHKGKVWAYSDGLGKGSTFIIRLPKISKKKG